MHNFLTLHTATCKTSLHCSTVCCFVILLPWSSLNSRMSIAIEALWIGRFRYFSPAQSDSLSPIGRSETRITLPTIETKDCKLTREIVFGRTCNTYPNASTYVQWSPVENSLSALLNACDSVQVYGTRAPLSFRCHNGVWGKMYNIVTCKCARHRNINIAATGDLIQNQIPISSLEGDEKHFWNNR